jgi:tRNA-specific 2-thiouridylase
VKFKLPNARKRDSQGICFLGNVSVEDFLAKEFAAQPGAAFDTSGIALGTHAGALLFTLGQRVHLEGAPVGPWYVIAKDIASNTLTVSHERRAEARSKLTLAETNWFRQSEAGKTCTAQYRYHGPRVSGTLDPARTTFTPRQPITEAVASGQSLVIYDEEECLGGGIIA